MIETEKDSYVEQHILEDISNIKSESRENDLLNVRSAIAKVKVNLDTVAYSSKPEGSKVGIISKRIIEHPVEISVEDLAIEIVKGKTFVPASFKEIGGIVRRSIKNWSSQQIVALDFDEGMTLEEAFKDKFFQDNASFLYTTFSHTEQHHKFRVVFVLDKEVTRYEDFELVIENLFERYPYADKACKDGSRLFFGGKKLFPFKYNNRLIVDDYIGRTPLKDIDGYIDISDTTLYSPVRATRNLDAKNITYILSKDISALRDMIHAEPVKLSINEVYNYLKKQDLRKFLGIEYLGTFRDIFHNEESPSASIFLSHKGTDHWLYKCHSESHPFTGTILHIVQRLLNCTIIEARNFLVQVYEIEIYESEAVKELKESIDIYKTLLISDELEEIHPYFYKVFNTHGYIMDFYVLLDFAKEFITNDIEPKIIFYHSISTLAKKLSRSKSTTGTRMNLFTMFKIIRKLDEHEIPEELLKIQKANKRKNHFQYHSSTYEIPLYSYDFFCEVDELCKIWLEKGCTSRTISYEGIYRTFGRNEADRVFPQDKGKEISEVNQEIVSQIHYIALKFIDLKGWTTQKEVLDNFNLNFRGQKEYKTTQLKRCLGEMLDAYDLKIIPSNKIIKKQLGITEEDMNKNSFPKLIINKI